MRCSLSYIPERLHSFGKEIVNEFFIGEELYYRCKSGQCSKPYQSISLYDVSHNRNFKNIESFPKEDVLFDIDESNNIEKILNREINISIITSLSENNTYEKKIVSEDDNNVIVSIKLIHTPLPCMFSHCSFQISLGETVVNKENYLNTLGKRKPKIYKNLRRDVRMELTSIIYSSSLSNDSETEIITEL